jgi:uncharacterized protein with PQ loop repeat
MYSGSNHGLFSLVAGASGARTIAFEPQTHLRSKSIRLKDISLFNFIIFTLLFSPKKNTHAHSYF